MFTEEYAPGRLIDVHGEGQDGIALFWHGRGPNERAAWSPLARAITPSGVRVLAADWDSTAADHGRSDVLGSLEHARRSAADLGIAPADVVVVGWSLGATAAVSLAAAPGGPHRTVLLAPGDGPRAVSPVTGNVLPDVFAVPDDRRTIEILHGSRDDIAHPALVLGLAARLRASGWAPHVTELAVDHSGIVGLAIDPDTQLYVEAHDPITLEAVDQVAASIVAAATASS
jgi:dienelactone hydrolase